MSAEQLTELSDADKVITLLNQAQSSQDTQHKLSSLRKVRELIIRKEASLLDNFLEEVISFLGDSSSHVKQFVIAFLEEACIQDPKAIIQVVPSIPFMLEDSDIHVVKRVIRCLSQLYKIAIKYVASMKRVDERIQELWETMIEIKNQTIELIDAENDGVRTFAIKFLEVLFLAHSKRTRDSEVPVGTESDISLENIPPGHPILKISSLREDAGIAVNKLLFLVASPSITSSNLMVCIASLTTVARQRPGQLLTVIQSFELLFANLPPNFTRAQVSSVRKFLKMQCLTLYRHHCAVDFKSQISTLLTGLGASPMELNKYAPRPPPEIKRRQESISNSNQSTGDKDEMDVDKETPEIRRGVEAVEMTAEEIRPLLSNPEVVTDIVISSLKRLPETMPSSFRDVYTPIESAGTEAQVRQLAKLLANQMTARGIGVGAEKLELSHSLNEPQKSDERKLKRNYEYLTMKQMKELGIESKKSKEEPQIIMPQGQLPFPNIISTLLHGSSPYAIGLAPMGPPLPPNMQPGTELIGGAEPMSVQSQNLIEIHQVESQDSKSSAKYKKMSAIPKPKQIKQFKLSDLTIMHMDDDTKEKLMVQSIKRIFEAEEGAVRCGRPQQRVKIIIKLITNYGGVLRDALRHFIVEDLKGRIELALAWLYQEYVIAQGYVGEDDPRTDFEQYDACLCGLLHALKDKLEPRDRLFSRLLLEAPRITESALVIVRNYCQDEDRVSIGIGTLKELILNRPSAPGVYLQNLLELTTHEKEEVRKQAILVAKALYAKESLRSLIEKFALEYLEYLKEDHPPIAMSDQDIDTEIGGEIWIEETIKLYFGLYMALLPLNHELIHQLALVYGQASNLIKKCILRYLQQPVSSIGMQSKELYVLLENCPSGAETLITRMLHILTEKTSPIPELVTKVKDLYYSRKMSDVRFLIPVLNGLEKQEIVQALPQLIQLSPNVVREVFHRLLNMGQDRLKAQGRLRPSELMVALHMIEARDEKQMKAVIQAIFLCFKETDVFTHEVLAGVLQQLLDMTPIPTLFMRTVIQSTMFCPNIEVIGILSKLITKQVWKQPKLWQGFVKCCQITKPQSFPTMLQLPPRQLENALEISPELREPIADHVRQYTPVQRARIPRPVLQLVEKTQD